MQVAKDSFQHITPANVAAIGEASKKRTGNASCTAGSFATDAKQPAKSTRVCQDVSACLYMSAMVDKGCAGTTSGKQCLEEGRR